MRIEQSSWGHDSGWAPALSGTKADDWNLVLVFGKTDFLSSPSFYHEVRSYYPGAVIFGCSTSGEICGTQVQDDSVVITAIHFEHSQCKAARLRIDSIENSRAAGEQLAREFPTQGLRHLLVLCDGLCVNGNELVKGLRNGLPDHIAVTGGMAGDGDRCQETGVLCDSPAERFTAAAVGFYGSHLEIGYGSCGGWDPFGPERLVTKSRGNVLYELDNHSALSLYKKYLGDPDRLVPLSLCLSDKESGTQVIRGVINTSDSDGSLIFGGDIPEGSYVRLMKTNTDRLVDGAITAAEISRTADRPPVLALLISCFARKLLLKQRTEEEVEGVQDAFGPTTRLAGFYSLGEISPNSLGSRTEFQNASMSITIFSEV